MKMTELKNVIDLGLSVEEITTLEQASDILHTIQTTFGEKLDLTSTETGEVVSVSELARVRGILSCFTDNRIFQYSISKRGE